jgi:hypothetical protein
MKSDLPDLLSTQQCQNECYSIGDHLGLLVGCGVANQNAARDAISFAKFSSRSHNAVIPVYDEAGKVTETHYGLDQQERK